MGQNLIYVRDDDVLIDSPTEDSFGRFKEIHEYISKTPGVLHVPTLVISSLIERPHLVEYIAGETIKGRMSPQIHGWNHVDYGRMNYDEVCKNLSTCKEWFDKEIGFTPTKWYTPWGAGESKGQKYLHEAATSLDLELVSCKDINKLRGRYGLIQLKREGHNMSQFLQGKEIFFHWWEPWGRLRQVLDWIAEGE